MYMTKMNEIRTNCLLLTLYSKLFRLLLCLFLKFHKTNNL